MGHFLLFLVHPPAPWVWGSEGRGEECRGGSARLLKFRIKLSPGNSAHLLSFPSTKCCGTAEYKVSNNFTFSCWKKYNWMQGKVNTQGNQKMGVSPTQTCSTFPCKNMLKILLLHNYLVFKTRDSRKRCSSSAAWHCCWTAWCAGNNTNCRMLRLVLCINLLSLSLPNSLFCTGHF